MITYELVPVAFLHSAGGAVRVLLCIDHNGQQLFGGEPVLLVEHRPGRPAHELRVEGPDDLHVTACRHVAAAAGEALAALIEGAFDELGAFDGQRMLGRLVSLQGPDDIFGR